MIRSTITSQGQTTLPKLARDTLGLSPGDQVRYAILDNNEVRIIPARSLSRLFGFLSHDGPPVTLEEMNQAIEEGVSGC